MIKKAIKIIFFAGVAVLVALFFLSVSGIIENNQGNSFGFPYKTAYTSFLLAMALIYACITDGRMGKAGLAVYACLTGYVLWLGGKTDFVLILLLTLVLSLIHFEKKGSSKFKTSVSSFMRFSFIMVCSINYLLVFSYRIFSGVWTAIPGLKTFKDRLLYSMLAFEEYPLTLFGTDVAFKGSYGESVSSLYFVLDSAYVKYLLDTGIIPFVLALTGLTALMFFLYKRRYYIQMFALSLFAIDLAMNGLVIYLILIVTFLLAHVYASGKKVEGSDSKKYLKAPVIATSLLTAAVIAGYITVVLPARRQDPEAIRVDIRVTDYDSASMDQLYRSLHEWEESHPGIAVEERERILDYDVASLAVMGPDHVPDIFIADRPAGRLMVDAGLVIDLSDYLEVEDGFEYDDGTYAFPALRESYSVIIYDKEAWHDGDPLGFDRSYMYSFIDCFLSPGLGDDWGQEWLWHLAEADGTCSFTDDEFVSRLDSAVQMMDQGIAYDSYDELEEAFMSGECHAVALSGDRVYSLLESVRSSDQDLYDRLGFMSLVSGIVPSGYEYGVFVRAGMDEQKTEECIELASFLASSVASGSEVFPVGFSDLLGESQEVRLLSQLFSYNFWHYSLNECYYNRDEGNLGSDRAAEVLQENYVLYYTDYQ